ncbi:MAG: TetR/AcrR family transcriptional regulator [Beijerinckiaceae bacterium]
MSTKLKSRLSGEDWLMAGFRALAKAGPSALRAEALARDLGTTKGSFYWHFQDIPDYLSRLIRLWEERAFDEVVAGLDGHLPARERLEKLCHLAVSFRDPSYGGAALEPALRAWALSSPEIANAVARMDSKRIAYLKELCREAGIHSPSIPVILYSVLIGVEFLKAVDDIDSRQDLLETLLNLIPQTDVGTIQDTES